MHSSDSRDPDHTRENDSRCTASSPSSRPTARGPKSKSARLGSLPIGIGALWDRGNRRLACVSQMRYEPLQTTSAAYTLNVFLCRQRSVPRQDLQSVKPPVPHYQKPSGSANRVQSANRARGISSREGDGNNFATNNFATNNDSTLLRQLPPPIAAVARATAEKPLSEQAVTTPRPPPPPRPSAAQDASRSAVPIAT
jgi:hypothetical protein